MNTYFRYRIGIINDFTNKTAFVDYRNYNNNLIILDVSIVGSKHKGYIESKDSIGIFLNFSLIKEFKIKEEARNFIIQLIKDSPTEFKQEFELYGKDIICII